ncbi:MAG: YfhO family protein [Alphaproteobacteria bacterium]
MNVRKPAIASLLCIVLFAVVMHWPIFLQGKTVSAFDLSYFTFITFREHRPADIERTSNGLLSDTVLLFNVWDKAMYEGPLSRPWLWNPYAACGSPLLANGQSAPLFPLKALAYGPGGVSWGFGFLCFLKMLLAGLGMYAYLRALSVGYLARTLGAISFMACAFLIVWLQFPITSVAFTLPLLLLGCERLLERRLRWGVVIVSATMAVGLLGGHPETSFHLTFTAAAYLAGRLVFSMVGRKDAPRVRPRFALVCISMLVLAVMLGAVVAAVQLVPSVESIRLCALLGERLDRSPGGGGHGSPLSLGNRRFMYRQLITSLVPNTWGNPSRHDHWWNSPFNYHQSAGYVGVGVLALALLAWRGFFRCRVTRVLALLQLLSLGFVLRIPLVTNTLGRLPLFNIAANSRFLLVWCLTAAAMAALCVDRLVKAKKFSRADMIWMAVIGLVCVFAVVRDYVKRFPSHQHDWITAYGRTQLVHCLVFLVPCLAVPLLPKLKARLRTVACGLLIALVAADLYLINFAYNPFIKPEQIYPNTRAIEFLQTQPPPVRVLPLDAEVGPNVLALYGLQDPRIYDAVVYGPYTQFLKRLKGEGPWNLVEEPEPRFSSIAGIKYIFARPEWTPPDTDRLRLMYEDELSRIYENRDALPLAFVSHQWHEAASPEAAYELLAREDFAWQSAVAVEANDNAPLPLAPEGEAQPHAPAIIASHQPHRVTINLPKASTGLLVLSDTFYPGWTAKVDGQSRPIYRTNGTFRGVFVTPEDTQVVFEYSPASFRYGIIMSLAGLAILAAIAIPIPSRLRYAFGTRRR